MKTLAAIIFFVAFAMWVWLEFVTTAETGLKDILFWVGMGAVLLAGGLDRARGTGQN